MRWMIPILLAAAVAAPACADAGEDVLSLVLKDHRFTPDQIEVPAGQRFRLEVVNADSTADEFESGALKVEKDIAPHGKLVLQLGPLAPGDYAFVGDLHADTAKGVLRAVGLNAARAESWALVDQWAGPDGGWDFSAFDAVHRRLYVARRDGVTAVEIDTGKVTPQLLAAGRAHAAIPINDGAEILVTSGASGHAIVADAQTGVVRATIAVGTKPDAALVEPATGLALVFDNAGGGVTLIDPRTAQAVGAIAAPGALESAAADGTGRVFANVEDLNEIAVFDVKARTVVAHWKLDGCERPSGLAFIPQAKLLVSACANKVAEVVAADSGKVVASLPIGGHPDWAGYDATRGAVLIPTGDDGVVNVVAVQPKPAVVARLAGHVGSRSGAVDPTTGRLYLPSADFTANPGAKPAPVAGTFKILVLGEVR